MTFFTEKKLIYLAIAYNGSSFHGFQRQPGLRTVESVLFDFLEEQECVDEEFSSYYSYGGRTDSGVNAFGQIISFLPTIECIKSRVLENSEPSDDIMIWGIRYSLPPEFKARYWVLYRDYLYIDRISNYILIDNDCFKRVINYFYSLRDFSFLYKDYRLDRYPKWYFNRRLLKFIVKQYDDYLFIMIRGESFPRYFVRRLVDFLRKYDCSLSFKENILSWKPGMAEGKNLFLIRAKTNYFPKILFSPSDVARWLLERVFKKESSALLRPFFSFLRFSWFSE